MPASFWVIVNKVLEKSDIILEVLDARLPEETRNRELEEKVHKSGKTIIYVINKSDLIQQSIAEKIKSRFKPSIFVSSLKHHGTTMLLHEIIKVANRKYPSQERITVGIVGYPNVGKSSVINALKGRASAPSSSRSGFTKHEQLIRITSRIYLIDTPGVYPFRERDVLKHVLTSSIDPAKLKDAEAGALMLIEQLSGRVEKFYGVGPGIDSEDTLEKIAFKRNKLKKGNIADTIAMAKVIIDDWQKGKIKL